MDAAEETMAGSDAAAEEAFGDIAASAPLLSEKSIEDAVGEFLLDLQHKTGIPAAALLPLILSLASLAVILLVQALFDLLVRVVFGGGRRGGSASSSSVLLLGVCGAGKTALFQTLRSGTPYLTTVTSMEENDATFTVEGKTRSSGVVSKKLRVVDLPGHPRVATNKLDVHVANARSAVFVLDAVDFASRRREVAERLRDALVTIARAKRRGTPFPVLVACNKSEKIAAHPIAFIKKMLEKEIDALERTAAGQLQDTGEGKEGRPGRKARDDTHPVSVTRRGVDPKKPFEFENAVADVSFSAVSVAENDLDELKSFAVVR